MFTYSPQEKVIVEFIKMTQGPEGFFCLTVQDKQGTHEQLSLNKKHTAVDHSGNNTVLISNKFNYYFWTICKHLLCAISYLGQY